jgi:hypothetical protein
MNGIYLNKSPIGAYQGIQVGVKSVPDGYAEFPEEFMPVFYPSDKRFAGFVDIVVENGVVTACAWNEEAYQAYCADHPEEPEPATEAEQLRADVDYLLMMEEG